MADERAGLPVATGGRPRMVALGCALAGLVIALYLSAAHASAAVPLYCSQSGLVDCARVTTSPSSVVAGVPVAYAGVLWFAVMAALLVPAAGGRLTGQARLLWSAAGVLAVLSLLAAELYVIGALCLWCSAVHLLVLLIFALTVRFPDGAEPATG